MTNFPKSQKPAVKMMKEIAHERSFHGVSLKIFICFALIWINSGLWAIYYGEVPSQYTSRSSIDTESWIDASISSHEQDSSETATVASSTETSDTIQEMVRKQIVAEVEQDFKVPSRYFIANMVISFLLSILYIGFLKYTKKFFVYFTLFLIWFSICGQICAFTRFLTYVFYDSSILNFSCIAIGLMSTIEVIMIILVVSNANKENIDIICQLITDACRAIYFCKFSMIIAIFGTVLLCGLAKFTIYVQLNLMSFYKNYLNEEDYYTVPPTSLVVWTLVNVLGWFWVAMFLVDLGNIALSSAFIAWHRGHEKGLLTENDMHVYMALGVRQHLGTAAYGSGFVWTLWVQIPFVMKVCTTARRKLFYVLYLIFSPRDVAKGVYSVALIEKTNFQMAAQKFYDIYIANPAKCLVLYMISISSALLGLIILALIFLMVPVNQFDPDSMENFSVFHDMYLPIFIPLIGIGYLLYIALATLTVCHMYDHHDSDALKTVNNVCLA